MNTFPIYKIQKRVHYGDYDINFGAWHLSDYEFRHKKRCFDVKYKFNSFGARDDFYKKSDEDRTILLGDSVVEGFGLNKSNTIDYLLEKKTKIDHLNFGTSGHFGTTQFNLMYQKIYKTFDHNKVILFLTVSNDFMDDSYLLGKEIHKNRYRPYLVLNENNKFELIYFDKNKLKKNNFDLKEDIRNLLYNYTNFYHLLRHIYVLTKSNKTNQKIVSLEKKSWFYDFSEREIILLDYNLSQIYKKTQEIGSELIVVLVGHKFDHNYKLENNKKKNLLYEKLLERFKNKNIKFVDAFNNLQIKRDHLNNHFFSCDSHHNEKGIKLIVDYIFKEIYEKN